MVAMSDQFIARAENIVDALLETSPNTAMWAGDHRYDDRLEDFSADAVAERTSMLREASHTLAEVDLDTLNTEESVDYEILSNQVASQLFTLTETGDHGWDPLLYNPGALLNALLLRPNTSAAERLTALQGRLGAVPDSLATARHNLSEVPRLHATTAAQQFRGTAGLVDAELPHLLAQEPGMAEQLNSTASTATTALREFADWLEQLPDGRSPRLGRRLWEAKLWHTLDTPLSASEVLERAWQRLDDISLQINHVAAQLVADNINISGHEATQRTLAGLSAECPTNDTIMSVAREALADTTAFVTEHDLVSIIDDPLEVVEMPEFARGVAAAYCDPPGSLETASLPTFFAISPAPTHWSESQVDSFFAEYNNHMLHDLTVHEAMPGHYLQLAHSRRYRGSTRARAIAMSGTFVEGWAVYAEELMADHGYGGLPVRMQQLKMQLRMVINAIIDQLIHCEDMTREAAMELMTERGFQSHEEAAGKWNRALLSSTQLSTYFVGYTEVSEIASMCPTGAPGRDWHDAMLAHGNPPPRHLRTILNAQG